MVILAGCIVYTVAISEFCWNINDLRVEMTVFVLVMVQIEILHNINSLTNIDKHMLTLQTPALHSG